LQWVYGVRPSLLFVLFADVIQEKGRRSKAFAHGKTRKKGENQRQKKQGRIYACGAKARAKPSAEARAKGRKF